VWNIFELHGPQKRVTQLEELSLSPGDLFANDWAIVVLDPRTGEVAK
jgi:glutamine cyclotransferase